MFQLKLISALSHLCFSLFFSSWGILNGITNEDPEAHRSVAQYFVFGFVFLYVSGIPASLPFKTGKVVHLVNICRVESMQKSIKP